MVEYSGAEVGETEQVTTLPIPLKSVVGEKKSHRQKTPAKDVFYSDSPRFLNKRYLFPAETTILGSLNHPLCVCPSAPRLPAALPRCPADKKVNTRDLSWLLQKLTGNSFEHLKFTETVILVNGKPQKVFFPKDGKLHCKLLSASSELFMIMRKWFGVVTRKSTSPASSPQHRIPKSTMTRSIEVCTLYFNDGAVKTLGDHEMSVMLKQRKPKRSQWADTKLVQFLPNAGSTFGRPLEHITYHYDEKLTAEKHHFAQEMRTSLREKETKVEEAIENIQGMLYPLFIAKGDFAFAQKMERNAAGESVPGLYLLGASNLIISQRREKEESTREEIITDVKYIDDANFLDSIENRTPTNKMTDVLEQLDDYYETKIRQTANTLPPSPVRAVQRLSNRGSVGGISSMPFMEQPPSPHSIPSTPMDQQDKFFSEEPPLCPDSARKPNFVLPLRPKSVGDLLGTSRSSTWFENDLMTRQINAGLYKTSPTIGFPSQSSTRPYSSGSRAPRPSSSEFGEDSVASRRPVPCRSQSQCDVRRPLSKSDGFAGRIPRQGRSDGFSVRTPAHPSLSNNGRPSSSRQQGALKRSKSFTVTALVPKAIDGS